MQTAKIKLQKAPFCREAVTYRHTNLEQRLSAAEGNPEPQRVRDHRILGKHPRLSASATEKSRSSDTRRLVCAPGLHSRIFIPKCFWRRPSSRAQRPVRHSAARRKVSARQLSHASVPSASNCHALMRQARMPRATMSFSTLQIAQSAGPDQSGAGAVGAGSPVTALRRSREPAPCDRPIHVSMSCYRTTHLSTSMTHGIPAARILAAL